MMTIGKRANLIYKIGFVSIFMMVAMVFWHLGRTQYLVEHETIATTARHLYESNGFLFYALEDALMRFGVYGLAERRWLSALSALVALPLLWWTMRAWAGRRAALCSAICLASNVMFLASGAYARFYALNMVCVLASTALVYAVARRDSWRAWVAYATMASVAVGTMMLSVLMIIPQGLLAGTASGWSRRSLKRFSIAALLPVLTFALLWGLDPQGGHRFHYGSAELLSAGQVMLANGSCASSLPAMYVFDIAPSAQAANALWQSKGSSILAIVTIAVWIAVWLPQGRENYSLHTNGRCSELNHRCVMALAGGVLISLLVLFGYSLGVKVVVSGENLSWLIPIVAVIFGYTLARRTWLRWAYLLALLLVPFWYWWATFFSCDTHDRYYNALPLRRQDIIICMRYRPNQPRESAYTVAGGERNLTDIGEAMAQEQPLFCDSEELLGGYLRQISCSPWARGQRVWLFYPWADSEYWRNLYAGRVIGYCASKPGWQVRQAQNSWGQVVVMRVP